MFLVVYIAFKQSWTRQKKITKILNHKDFRNDIYRCGRNNNNNMMVIKTWYLIENVLF